MGTCLGFDFTTTSRTTNNPDTLVPTFGHYSSSSAGLTGPTTNQTSSYDNYTISPSNTTAANSSYTLTYMNNFYQNAAYATTLIRAFDSYTSTDGGNTWTAPTSGSPQLPPSSYASVPGGDVPLFKSGAPRLTPRPSRTWWGAALAERLVGARRLLQLHQRLALQRGLGTEQLCERHLLRLYPGARLLRQDLFHLAARPAPAARLTARPRSSSYFTASAFQQYLTDLGIATATTGSTLAAATRRLSTTDTGRPTDLALAQRRRHDAQHLPDHERLRPRRQPHAQTTDPSTSRSCVSTTGTTRSTTWARPPATGGSASSAPTTIPSCSTLPGH